MYPKKKNELLNKFFKDQVFESGTSVWGSFEQKNYYEISQRNLNEVFYTVRLYYEFKRKIMKLREIEEQYKKAEKRKLKELESLQLNEEVGY